MRTCNIEGCTFPTNGRRGLCNSHYHSINKPRIIPKPGKKVTSLTIRVNGQSIAEHIYKVEQILGRKLPPNVEVHHIDSNRRNNANSNLLVCPSGAYHMLIHRRTRAYKACGNPNWERCSRCHQWSDPSLMIVPPGTRAYGQNRPRHIEWCRRVTLAQAAALASPPRTEEQRK